MLPLFGNSNKQAGLIMVPTGWRLLGLKSAVATAGAYVAGGLWAALGPQWALSADSSVGGPGGKAPESSGFFYISRQLSGFRLFCRETSSKI